MMELSWEPISTAPGVWSIENHHPIIVWMPVRESGVAVSAYPDYSYHVIDGEEFLTINLDRPWNMVDRDLSDYMVDYFIKPTHWLSGLVGPGNASF